MFLNRKPLAVPDALAAELLKDEARFVREQDMQTPAEDRFGHGPIMIQRWGAIGDLMMLRAAASAFARHKPHFPLHLRCNRQFAHLFRGDPIWWKVTSIGVEPFHVERGSNYLNLDLVVEVDHEIEAPHRADLFLRALTMDKTVTITEEDWRMPIPAATEAFAAEFLGRMSLSSGESGRPLVALQVRGSGPMKSMPAKQIKALGKALSRWANVLLIESSQEHVWEAPGIFAMTDRDVLHSIAALRHADLCICFDSGVLWMAHCAPCPVLCVMGPTRPEQRISRHPLYEKGLAKAVCLNQVAGIEKIVRLPQGQTVCPPCFEQAKACGRRFSCMQEQPDTVVQIIEGHARLMLATSGVLPSDGNDGDGQTEGDDSRCGASGSVPA